MHYTYRKIGNGAMMDSWTCQTVCHKPYRLTVPTVRQEPINYDNKA